MYIPSPNNRPNPVCVGDKVVNLVLAPGRIWVDLRSAYTAARVSQPSVAIGRFSGSRLIGPEPLTPITYVYEDHFTSKLTSYTAGRLEADKTLYTPLAEFMASHKRAKGDTLRLVEALQSWQRHAVPEHLDKDAAQEFWLLAQYDAQAPIQYEQALAEKLDPTGMHVAMTKGTPLNPKVWGRALAAVQDFKVWTRIYPSPLAPPKGPDPVPGTFAAERAMEYLGWYQGWRHKGKTPVTVTLDQARKIVSIRELIEDRALEFAAQDGHLPRPMRRDFRKWMHEQDYQFMERIIHEKRTTGDVTFQGEPIFGPDPEYPQEA